MQYTRTRPPIAWQETGSGTPLLLVMGASFDSRMWYRALPALSKQHRVLLYDNRGIGNSPMPRGQFSISDLAADAIAVLDAAGVEKAHVYGVSMGGVVAQEIALAYPERVRSLVLGCTGAPDGVPVPVPRSARLRRLIPRKLAIRLLPGVITSSLYGTNPPRDAVREDLAILASTRAPAWVIEEQGRAVGAYDSRSRVPSLTVPTLVLHGTADRVVPLFRGEDLTALIPGARLHVLEGAGHNYVTDVGDAANEPVLRFLAEAEEEVDATPAAER